jgi:hypothetical protein
MLPPTTRCSDSNLIVWVRVRKPEEEVKRIMSYKFVKKIWDRIKKTSLQIKRITVEKFSAQGMFSVILS